MSLRIHGVDSDIRVRRDTIFPDGGILTADERATVVLSNPPFDLKEPAWVTSELHGRYGSLPSNRTSFAWLQYVLSSLAKGGRAAVVMPVGTLFREGAEKQVRANMLDDGVVEAVIVLPPQMFVSTSIPVAVWLLRSDARDTDEILVIDATDLGTMISRTQRSLTAEDENRIVDTVTWWRGSDHYKDSPGFSASITVRRIREQEYVLTPARYVGTAASLNMPSRSVHELREELVRLEHHAATVDAAVETQLNRIQTWTL